MCSLYTFTQSLLEVKLSRLGQNEAGQTMVEYVLMLLLVALIVILALPAVATAISGAFATIAAAFGP